MSTVGGEDDGARFRTFTARGEVDLAQAWTLDALYRWREAEVEFDTFSGGPSGFQRADDADLESEDQLQVWAVGLSKDRGDFRPRLRVGEVTTALDSFDIGGLTDSYESERDFVSASFDYSFRVGHGIKDPEITVGLDWQDDQINTDTAFNAPLSASEDVVSAFAIGRSGFDLVELSASVRVDDYDAFGEQTTANVGLVWELWRLNTVLRASYGTSYKAPTLSERFASSAFITPNPDLEPEEGESFELGFETVVDFRWRRDGLRFGAVWYDSEIENLIENVFDFATFTGTSRNIGRADLTGWELFLALSPNDVFDVRFDYTHTDATDADTGDALLRRPEHAASVSAAWQVTRAASLVARYSYTGERLDVTYDDDGLFVSSAGEVDAFETVDLTGRYDVAEGVEVFAAVRNLFDESYEQPAAFAGAPRTVSIGVRWRP
jgi:vitamin B12 transporter